MAGIRLQVHNLIQILVIASRHALLQAGFFYVLVYQMSTIKPSQTLARQGFTVSSICILERYVYQMSTNLTFYFHFC